MDYYFCTISSNTRLYQCIALYNSLAAMLENIKFFVLCMDKETYSIISALKSNSLIPVGLESIEDEAAVGSKADRNLSEYCWTMKPVFIESILNNVNDVTRITYLDADMFFFNTPKPIYTFGSGKSIWLTPHNYSEKLRYAERDAGRYNSGFISFKNDNYSIECLQWWKKSCLDWCYNRTEEGRFGDQKYLDIFCKLFHGVADVVIPGVNIAPWNDEKAVFHRRNGLLMVNGHRLICYHFCGFRPLNKSQFIVQFGNKCNEMIHRPYMKAVKNVADQVEKLEPGFDGFYHMDPKVEAYTVFNVY